MILIIDDFTHFLIHHSEHAVAITDTAAAKAFWASHPRDSVIDTRTTIRVNGVDSANPQLNNWKGDKKDESSLIGQFLSAKNRFEKAGYPTEYLDDYANVYMMWKLKMGIKFYRKVNGVFKELNYDSVTKKITISQ